MKKNKKVSIYVRNKDVTPSSYYRIIQYAKNFENHINIREIAPKKLYKMYLDFNKDQKIGYYIISLVYYITMVLRSTYYLLIDYKNKPEYLIVSKTFCPRYTPIFLRFLIKNVSQKSKLYWDFDDYIFNSGEISKKQSLILEKNSKNIIVTNNFLKSKINVKYQSKVILLPTTDGDMKDVDKKYLEQLRKDTFNYEIKLVWVATGGNIPNLMKIIDILDIAADKLKNEYNKELILTVVCNKPIDAKVTNLKIRNIKWTRDTAKQEIYNAHIGIMPLIYRDYALGKGGFKLVQYISTGLPVIASNVGFNNEVVDKSCGILVDDREFNNGWLDSIIQIANSWENWKRYSHNSYRKWNSNFSYNNNLDVWKDLLLK